METTNDRVLQQMQALIQKWTASQDSRRIFLSCYQLMTQNMLEAVDHDQFYDSNWVHRLLNRFADYYFIALDAYDSDPQRAPLVWQVAHNATRNSKVRAIQTLLLGVNAHINYDLVLALEDVLKPEWDRLEEIQRQNRHDDHVLVNTIITETIDAVQDDILEPEMPFMDFIDDVFGRLDEYVISNLISNWRDNVWDNAMRILCLESNGDREEIVTHLERDALKIGRMIYRGE